jgi:hypothetical protein
MMKKQNKILEDNENLQSLINIGPTTAKRLNSIGITKSTQLRNLDPEETYEKLKEAEGGILDKCVLYQLRGAVLNIPWWLCKDLTKNKKGDK